MIGFFSLLFALIVAALPWIGLAVVVGLLAAGVVVLTSRRFVVDGAAQELEFARLRLAAEGVDVDDLPAYVPPTDWRVDDETTFEERTARLVVDPTLSATDVAAAIEHIEPGIGSVASFVEARNDTRMRTSAERLELQRAEEAAYAEREEQEVRLMMADFDRAMHAALTDFAICTRVVRKAEAVHADGVDACPHCRAAVEEISQEFALMVAAAEETPTGAYSRSDLRAMGLPVGA